MADLLPITITIADRNFRIKVEAAQEETVRKTVKFLNDKLLEFKQQYAGKDMQDYVSMVLVWYATQQANEVNKELFNRDLQEGFERINLLIDKGIQVLESEK